MQRKTFTALAALAILGAFSTAALADYPEKPIKIVWPYASGGVGEALGRILAAELSARLGQGVVVESRPGAGRAIGFQAVKAAPPDGYTLLLGTIAPLTLAPSLSRKLPYDPVKDYEPIAMAFSSPYVIVVKPSLPVKTLAELTAYAKANPGKLNYGSSGNAATQHVLNAAYDYLIGAHMTHVAYKGNAQAVLALLAGDIDMMFASTDVMPHVAAGKVRALAVTGKRRLAVAPEIPTAIEAGMPEVTLDSWYGLMAPAGTPAPIIERLQREMAALLATPKVHEQVKALSTEIVPDFSTRYFRETIRSETIRWKPLVAATGIVAD